MDEKFQIHTMGVDERWFDAIACGKKTVEGRKWTETKKEIKVGDRIEFSFLEKKVVAVVMKINVYQGENALDKYIIGETLEKILPGVDTLEEARKIYLACLGKKGASEEEQMKSIDEIGMVGFHIAKI
ncbi:MAG: hypothetical protein Harvfovirus9_3 [Harvfovirus sp.]|uniref:ASCH domain-containing protein n=1 Tax=Harvfovirus sp. TaxID=2487768 RepID=A0A3G5A4Y1_9VIRU|nr:MAG: hypothetical protein Harvfovirus9_3 [Harvfovirus sp.]